jgi:predicted nucleotidyltransferase
MAIRNDLVLEKARLFLDILRKHGFNISEAYVFGSSVKTGLNEESDIDIAVVSKDFEGLPYYDVRKISRIRRQVDLRLEIHPFSERDILDDPPFFFKEIKKSGIRVA